MTKEEAIALDGEELKTKDGKHTGYCQGLHGDRVRISMVPGQKGQLWPLDLAGQTFTVPRA